MTKIEEQLREAKKQIRELKQELKCIQIENKDLKLENSRLKESINFWKSMNQGQTPTKNSKISAPKNQKFGENSANMSQMDNDVDETLAQGLQEASEEIRKAFLGLTGQKEQKSAESSLVNFEHFRTVNSGNSEFLKATESEYYNPDMQREYAEYDQQAQSYTLNGLDKGSNLKNQHFKAKNEKMGQQVYYDIDQEETYDQIYEIDDQQQFLDENCQNEENHKFSKNQKSESKNSAIKLRVDQSYSRPDRNKAYLDQFQNGHNRTVTDKSSVKNFKRRIGDADVTSIGMQESMFEMDSMSEIFETLDSAQKTKKPKSSTKPALNSPLSQFTGYQQVESSADKITRMKLRIQKIEKEGHSSPRFTTELLKQKLSQQAEKENEMSDV
jgi:regulator of replication initiation timing